MMDFLNSFKSLIKLEQIRIDNNVFRLHYKLTVIMLIFFSVLLTSKQYFGDPIQCQVNEKANENKQIIETYCWIYGTYILKKTLKDDIRRGIPGLGNDQQKSAPWGKFGEEVIWQKYYQWVCIVFCFQALFFYLPRYLWKTWEGGRLRLLVSDLNGPLVTATWNPATKAQLVNYLLDGKYLHNLYAFRYTICEFLNLLNVVGQIFLMDWLLTGQFSFYGIAMMTSQDVNPMTQVFPKLTKCQFYKYGPTGSVENRDALCVLPLNILNEKLFLVLWFWLFLLAFITLVSLIYRMVVMASLKFRVYLLMAQARLVSYRQVFVIIKHLNYGDFFVLYHLGKNINPIIFKELVSALFEAIKARNSNRYYPQLEVR